MRLACSRGGQARRGRASGHQRRVRAQAREQGRAAEAAPWGIPFPGSQLAPACWVEAIGLIMARAERGAHCLSPAGRGHLPPWQAIAKAVHNRQGPLQPRQAGGPQLTLHCPATQPHSPASMAAWSPQQPPVVVRQIRSEEAEHLARQGGGRGGERDVIRGMHTGVWCMPGDDPLAPTSPCQAGDTLPPRSHACVRVLLLLLLLLRGVAAERTPHALAVPSGREAPGPSMQVRPSPPYVHTTGRRSQGVGWLLQAGSHSLCLGDGLGDSLAVTGGLSSSLGLCSMAKAGRGVSRLWCPGSSFPPPGRQSSARQVW
jgi:hypothetical protein